MDAALHCLENPEEDFRNILEKQLSVDDLVYQGSIVAFQKNQLDHRAEAMPLNNVALYHLLNVGARDMDAIDKPWDTLTCSMRFATCLGDHLWTMIACEQNRVCVLCLFVCKKLNAHFRTIVWRRGSASWRRLLLRWSLMLTHPWRTQW